VKRVTDPMLDFKSFWSAQMMIVGIETMHMVKRGQVQHCPNGQRMSVSDQFYCLAF
jgi:transposase-like protein